MEDFQKEAKVIAQKAASREGIIAFLKICAENPTLSLPNLLLVYEQCPSAGIVCGKVAWEQMGRKIKAEAVPIKILYPVLVPGQQLLYCTVNVYDYASTTGEELQREPGEMVWADRIALITGATWELVSEEALQDGMERGGYDREKNVFYLSKSCVGKQQDQTMIGLYIEYVLWESGIQDRLVKLAVTFVVYEQLGFRAAIARTLFGKLEKLSADEKLEFLQKVCCVSKRVIDDLTGCRLGFEEVAYINSLLVSEGPEEIRQIFEQAAGQTDNEEVRKDLLLLLEKLMKAKQQCRSEIYRKRCQRQLFTYPPMILEFMEDDFLRRERGSYHAD